MVYGLSFRSARPSKQLAPTSRAQSRQGAVPTYRRGQEQSDAHTPASIFFGPGNARKSPATAPASALDILAGRGDYMKEYKKQRKEIVRDYMRNKRKELDKWRRMETRLKRDLRKQDRDVYQEYKISSLVRPDKEGLSEKEQYKRAKKVEEKVITKFRRNKRDAIRDLRKGRDKQISSMKKELREAHSD